MRGGILSYLGAAASATSAVLKCTSSEEFSKYLRLGAIKSKWSDSVYTPSTVCCWVVFEALLDDTDRQLLCASQKHQWQLCRGISRFCFLFV